jgi:hypothetical protein
MARRTGWTQDYRTGNRDRLPASESLSGMLRPRRPTRPAPLRRRPVRRYSRKRLGR